MVERRGRVKKTVVDTVIINACFLLLLGISSLFSTPEALHTVLRYAAYVLPLVLFVILVRRSEEKRHFARLLPRASDFGLVAPVVAPAVAGVMLLAFLTSLLFSLVGKGGGVLIEEPLFEAILVRAFIPAVLEELIFRYVPLTLIAPHSKKSALVISALLFALAHCTLLQIPYAFFAGAVYMWVALMTDSILPSVLLHLLNNVVAIVWQKYIFGGEYMVPVLVLIGLLALASLFLILYLLPNYKKRSAFLFDKGDRVELPLPVLYYTGALGAVAILAVF